MSMHVAPYDHAQMHSGHEPDRRRKLLLHRSELDRLRAIVDEQHLSLIPLALYFKDGRAKVELALARGRKTYDKRQALAKRDAEREAARAVSRGDAASRSGRQVAMAGDNTAMAELWNGLSGENWIRFDEHHDRGLRRWGEAVLAAAAPAAGERVLDVGCGTGWMTRAAARAVGDGHALGVDISELLVARATAKAEDEGVANVAFTVADAQDHPFEPESVDLAISRFGVMFFADAVAAFANVSRALAPGGRLAFACWQELRHNHWILVPSGPWPPRWARPSRPPRTPRDRGPWPTPTACARCSAPPASSTWRWRPWRSRCGSATRSTRPTSSSATATTPACCWRARTPRRRRGRSPP